MKQAQYVTIHMENDPYALGMAGPNTPIHHLPAVVAPHPTGSTIPCYTQDDLRTLHPMYTQWLNINNAVRHTVTILPRAPQKSQQNDDATQAHDLKRRARDIAHDSHGIEDEIRAMVSSYMAPNNDEDPELAIGQLVC